MEASDQFEISWNLIAGEQFHVPIEVLFQLEKIVWYVMGNMSEWLWGHIHYLVSL